MYDQALIAFLNTFSIHMYKTLKLQNKKIILIKQPNNTSFNRLTTAKRREGEKKKRSHTYKNAEEKKDRITF